MCLTYLGSKKHKRWVPGGASGSICPNWTHTSEGRHFGAIAPEDWNGWPQTQAQALLTASVAHEGQRYAAARGIAFCGQCTEGGTWHGYPVLWRDVPTTVRQVLENNGQATPQEIRRGLRAQKDIDPHQNLTWAAYSDDI